jgi:hypothetical protein
MLPYVLSKLWVLHQMHGRLDPRGETNGRLERLYISEKVRRREENTPTTALDIIGGGKKN